MHKQNTTSPVSGVILRVLVIMACGGVFLPGCDHPTSSSAPNGPHPVLNEQIPYTALGHGTLVFQRGSFLYFLDADAKRWNALLFENNQPVVSPDGKTIAYSGCVGCNFNSDAFEIFLVDRDGSHVRDLSGLHDYSIDPHWMGDSTVLYLTSRNSQLLYRQSVNGLQEKSVISSPGFSLHFDANFAVTRDGMLAISSDRSLYTMDLQGNNLLQIASVPLQIAETLDSPSWSPDGSAIAYLHASWGDAPTPQHVTELVKHVVATGQSQVLYQNAAYLSVVHESGAPISSVCWSPDGTKLAFTMPAGEGYSTFIFVVNADGTGATQVTSTPDQLDTSISWLE